MEVSSSGRVTNIFPATLKVGMLQAIFSTVSGRERQIRRTSSASCMERTVTNGTDKTVDPGPKVPQPGPELR
ncbi:hypothetical protein GCM10010372_29760 [Streptomyces tauricus]|nr:hypothetical protein GCM10010372_29760 [Streptomyces tauricus]